jgi:hypothetical protein
MGPSVSATLEGNIAGPCPRCGGFGLVPSGFYHILQEAVAVVTHPSVTAEDLRRLARILEEEQTGLDSDAERVVERVEKEAPSVRGLRRILTGEGAAWLRFALHYLHEVVRQLLDWAA